MLGWAAPLLPWRRDTPIWWVGHIWGGIRRGGPGSVGGGGDGREGIIGTDPPAVGDRLGGMRRRGAAPVPIYL